MENNKTKHRPYQGKKKEEMRIARRKSVEISIKGAKKVGMEDGYRMKEEPSSI